MKIIIVGGVAGGASAAARLRRLNEKAEIILFEKGEYISFANCGLPYYIGGEIKDKNKLTLQTPESFNKRFNVDVRVLNEVTKINRKEKSVTVKDIKSGEVYTENYDKLVLSPGSEPVVLDFAKHVGNRMFTLRNIPDTYRIKDFIDNNKPQTAVVAGGGYIGIEMAENLHNAGIDVTVVELMDHVIGPIDYDVACDVHKHIESKGVRLLLKSKLNEIREQEGCLEIILDKKAIKTDMLIMSVGVCPDSNLAKDANLDMNPGGCIIVNDNMQTCDPDIYAAGDAVEITDFVTGRKGFVPLAGPANKQGRIIADHINGIESTYKKTMGTAILKCFDMTVACTGINEKTAQEEGLEYEKSFTYSASHASYYPGAVSMAIKLLFKKDDGKILGAQITGYDGVDKRMDVIATAIRAGMTVFDLTELELAYAPPFSSAKDPVNMAGYVAENILKGKVEIFHWHDVDKIDGKDSVILDVRTQYEYDIGNIPGSVNIPVDDLRGKIESLDKSKKYFVLCQIGLRGYIATRILTQNGFTALNLSGGYRLYSTIFVNNDDGCKVSTASENEKGQSKKQSVFNEETQTFKSQKIQVDAAGLQCPGPILSLAKAVKEANENDIIEIKTTDPAFISDSKAFCKRTGNTYIGMESEKGISVTTIQKGSRQEGSSERCDDTGCVVPGGNNSKNIIVFSGDLDKAIASFIIANAAAAMGRKVTMFFTFWGLNMLRKPKKIKVKKNFISKMFAMMMPRGSGKLKLSNMNMMGMGAKMIRKVMKGKNISSLEDLIQSAMENGVELVACTMSMDVMGIKQEELIDGVKMGGAAAMLANAEESDMSLFI